MGTTLTALIEHRKPGETLWHLVATFKLNKHYSLMDAIRELATTGWPDDAVHARTAAYDFARYWLDGSVDVSPAGTSEHELKFVPSPEWHALQAARLALVRRGDTRVLYVEI